jgi:hypothetical protein
VHLGLTDMSIKEARSILKSSELLQHFYWYSKPHKVDAII